MRATSSSMPTGDEPDAHTLSIAIVGPCGAGKSTLADHLVRLGFQARQIAQEHSFVPDMWQQLTDPDILIFLEASFDSCSQRKALDWTIKDYQEQMRRLAHAHKHGDIVLDTDGLTPQEILQKALDELQ
jgi:ABC-type glutathione transport system ATPase component